ncbi:MAG: DEAD/DEAH box helicase family protein [Prevotellaceae bacterium]|jgi:superfamily II DNA or RNA helicase|nr:DEAD/DEAH box helicase family protein [Prevotellaceae bacterium]
MNKIKLPQLERVVFQKSGCKNIILQLITPLMEIPFNIIETGRSFVVIDNNGEKYCLTCNKNKYPDDCQFVLLTDQKPTEENLRNKTVVIKTWIKHPLELEYSTEDVISSWTNSFSYKEENSDLSIQGLRTPQLGALHSILGHLQLPLDTATVVLPTGTGKTETMLATLVSKPCKLVLVTVPSDSLRKQLFDKFKTLGLLKHFGIIGNGTLYPIVGMIREKFKTVEDLQQFLEKCNVIVTTMPLLIGCSIDEQKLIASICSNIFIDEAHHVKAPSWNNFKKQFPKEKVIQFTATPFRNDGQRLDGKIIFNFPLKLAQEQGYFTKIDFIPVREYDADKADIKISEVAVKRLASDIEKGFKHILMARCATKEKAKKIFELYNKHTEYNPVIIYSGCPDYTKTYLDIIQKKTQIIVCVDMLGEGFDLPELKIAAFHDIRKSLPITLQFAGRFTRTKYDEKLGNASFVANIADLNVKAELEELYADGANWNQLLSDVSFGRINNEEEYKKFIDGFENLNNSDIPFSTINPKFSTVVYKNKTDSWFPANFYRGITGYDELDYKFHDINKEEKIIVVITAKKENVEWVRHKDIQQFVWNMIIVYWETRNNLLFINSSDNSSLYKELAEAVIGDTDKTPELIRGIDVFKSFYDIDRTRLKNVGLKYYIGKSIRFRMNVGFDVAEALSIAERHKGEKAFVVGSGYEKGEQVNIGASYKGRIWSVIQKGDLRDFKQWCVQLGNKLANETIGPNQILKETLIPESISEIPHIQPVCIDWDEEVYMNHENNYRFSIGGSNSTIANTDLHIVSPKEDNRLLFSLVTDFKTATFELILFNETTQDISYNDFKIEQITKEPVKVSFGSKVISGVEFFSKYIPTVWFADGSALTGNEYIQLKQQINVYPKENIIAWNWQGISLEKESQQVNPKLTDSIQYRVIGELKKSDFDIIYDDDYSGEIADVITMKLCSDKLCVGLYHLKYAIDGKVSGQIKNLYEVCGQAQKSVHWKHKEGTEFLNHLLRRETKTRNGQECSRLEVGTKERLIYFLSIAKQKIPMEFEIFIVQPSVSKENATNEILTLLGVTDMYLKDYAGINLKVIANI